MKPRGERPAALPRERDSPGVLASAAPLIAIDAIRRREAPAIFREKAFEPLGGGFVRRHDRIGDIANPDQEILEDGALPRRHDRRIIDRQQIANQENELAAVGALELFERVDVYMAPTGAGEDKRIRRA